MISKFGWLVIVVIVVSGILLLCVLWNKSLKKKMNEGTAELKALNELLELEIAEHKQAETLLSESRKNLLDVQSMAHLGDWSWEIKTNKITWSDEVYRIYGFAPGTPLAYERLMEVVHPEDRDYHDEHTAAWLENKGGTPFEYRVVLADNSIKHVYATGLVECDETGEPIRMYGTIQEVTERKQVEMQKRLSSEILANIHEGVSLIRAEDGVLVFANPAFENIFGYAPKEVIGKHVSILNAPMDKSPEEIAAEIIAEINTKGQWKGEIHNIKKDGTPFWCYAQVNFFEQSEYGTVWVTVHTDISERKQAEDSLQQYQKKLKSLTVQLALAEEQERRIIAEGLHDEVGQSLALTRMQLATARKDVPKGGKQDELFEDMSNALLKAVQDIRSLIFELSSPSLNELGLVAAISEWMDENATKKHGLKVELFDHVQDVTLDVELRAILFRNVRELLTNVIKHAQAKIISVWLESTADGLEITIQDDGVGFDVSVDWHSDVKGGFGLFSIQERMTDLGGKLMISSQPGEGCKVVLFLPLQEQNPEIKV